MYDNVHDYVVFIIVDFDVSRFYVFEDNEIHCTETGTIPHGNSISGYDYRTHVQSNLWSFSRNTMTRPPNNDNATHQNWMQRETVR